MNIKYMNYSTLMGVAIENQTLAGLLLKINSF